MIGKILTTIFGGVVELGKGVIERRKEITQTKHQRKITKIKAKESWEDKAVSQGENSWKDEYVTIYMSLPFAAIFIFMLVGWQEGVQRVQDTFTAMEATPEWFVAMWAMVIAAAIGRKIVEMTPWSPKK